MDILKSKKTAKNRKKPEKTTKPPKKTPKTPLARFCDIWLPARS